jgi:hypothetical protein
VNAQIYTAIATSVATLVLTFIAGLLVKMHRMIKRFLGEHTWLMESASWAHIVVPAILSHLKLNLPEPPPYPQGKK